jgi:cytoskeletal protein RodZ
MLTDKQINAAFLIFGDVKLNPQDLKLRYRELAKKNHPDLTKDDGRQMLRINRAYEILQELLNNGFTYTTTTTTETTTKTTSKTTVKPRKPRTIKVRVQLPNADEVEAKVQKHPTEPKHYLTRIKFTRGMELKVGSNDWMCIDKPCNIRIGKTYIELY